MIKHTKSYIKGHPRPRFVRDQFQMLDGIWSFQFDDQRIGKQEQWYLGLSNPSSILVPFAYQSQQSGIGETKQHEVVWYETHFDASRYPVSMLHFDGSDYLSSVWLNGVFLGTNEGGYHRFSFDVSKAIQTKSNQLVVRVEDTFDTRQPRGKQRWKPENFGCWYVETTGIWKSVWLEYMQESFLEDAQISTHLQDMSISISYGVNQIKPQMVLNITVTQQDQVIARLTQELIHANQDVSFSIKTIDDQFKIKTWSADHPHLYDVHYELFERGQCVDVVQSYFAVRHWETIHQSIYLNGEPVELKMILDQGYWSEGGMTPLDETYLIHDIQLTKEMGFNGIRKHQKIEDERFYYYCDILGVYVWLEMPSAYEFDAQMVQRMTTQWMHILRQYQGYPSIMTYVLMNESWGVPQIKHHPLQQQFTVGLYHLTKAFDPTRFVISNDGWEHTKSDLITIHDYVETGEAFKEIYKHMDALLSHQFVKGHRIRSIFADGYQYQGQPILISEYGGIAFKSSEGWGYGAKVESSEAYLLRLKGLTKVIQSLPNVIGYCLTQIADVEQETNGVLDHAHQPKVDVRIIRQINENR